MSGVCPELTPMLDNLYVLASVLDGRSRAVPSVLETLTVVWFGGAARVAGEIDVDSAAELASALAPLTVPGSRVCVDMAAVTFIGSHGVRLLNGVAAALGPSGRLALVAPSRPVRRALELLGAHDGIEIIDPDPVQARGLGSGSGWSAPADVFGRVDVGVDVDAEGRDGSLS